MKDFISKLKKRHIIIFILLFLFMPFPTEMVPKWEMQVVDEENQSLANVRTTQSWQSYTFFASEGHGTKCTDAEGKVIYPARFLWAGTLSRIFSPILADIMTLAHGSTGTVASIQVFDKHYISENYYWREKEKIYTRTRSELPKIAVAEKRSTPRDDFDCK